MNLKSNADEQFVASEKLTEMGNALINSYKLISGSTKCGRMSLEETDLIDGKRITLVLSQYSDTKPEYKILEELESYLEKKGDVKLLDLIDSIRTGY